MLAVENDDPLSQEFQTRIGTLQDSLDTNDRLSYRRLPCS